MSKLFVGDVDNRALRYGHGLITASDDVEPGLLVTITSGSLVDLAGASDEPNGVAYGARHQEYRPTTNVFGAGEQVTVLMGDFLAYYSADFFSGGSLPSAGDDLYAAANGLLATSGTNHVGKCNRVFANIQEVAGVGTSRNLAEVVFEIGK